MDQAVGGGAIKADGVAPGIVEHVIEYLAVSAIVKIRIGVSTATIQVIGEYESVDGGVSGVFDAEPVAETRAAIENDIAQGFVDNRIDRGAAIERNDLLIVGTRNHECFVAGHHGVGCFLDSEESTAGRVRRARIAVVAVGAHIKNHWWLWRRLNAEGVEGRRVALVVVLRGEPGARAGRRRNAEFIELAVYHVSGSVRGVARIVSGPDLPTIQAQAPGLGGIRDLSSVSEQAKLGAVVGPSHVVPGVDRQRTGSGQ